MNTAQPQPVFSDMQTWQRPHTSAVFTGDGFLVTAAGQRDGGAGGLPLARVALDGTVTFPATASSTSPSLLQTGADPRLAWTGGEGRLVVAAGGDGGGAWARVDRSGHVLGEAVTLNGFANPFAPMLAMNGQTFVVLGTSPGETGTDDHVDLARVSADGEVTALGTIVRDPYRLSEPRLARRGSEVILSWIGGVRSYPGTIGLARLAP